MAMSEKRKAALAASRERRARAREFRPGWCIAPSETLREWLDEMGLPPPVLAVACAGRERKDEALALITDVLERRPLMSAHAVVLARGTGVSRHFWENLEHNYRAGLAAGLTDVSDK